MGRAPASGKAAWGKGTTMNKAPSLNSGRLPGLLFLVLLLFLLPGMGLFSIEEVPPKPEDFAGAYGLTGQAGGLLRLELPAEVFMGAERPDLGDLRIFDAKGVPAPYVIREVPGRTINPPPRDIPFFVWKQGDEKALLKGTDIEINTSGAVVQIKNQSQREGSPPVYLADLSGLYLPDQGGEPPEEFIPTESIPPELVPTELLIETAHGGRFFNTPVTVHYSSDLSHWTLFERKQILSFYGSAGANRDTLILPKDGKIRYLLIRMEPGAPPPEKMTVRFDPATVPAGIREKSIRGETSDGGKTLRYNTGGFYPAFEIDFVLPQADSFQVTIRNRYSEDDEWNDLGRATIFRYNSPGGEPQKNSPLPLSGSAPFWELAVSGERSVANPPELVIRWKMRELIFLALGEGPWTLAYGNAGFGPPAEGSLPQLERGSAEQIPPSEQAPLELLPAFPTGLARYEPRPQRTKEDPAFGVWVLWGVLILAVILLSSLAFVIARSMRN
jgi:hypothetical protein